VAGTDDERERFARIEQILEEYRLNHEDFEAYVEMVRARARDVRRRTRQYLDDAKTRLANIKKRPQK